MFLNLPENSFLSNKLRKYLNEKKNFNLSLREVSRHLRDFKEKRLVNCVNKKDPYNKIYGLTLKGKRLKKDVLKSNL